MDWLYNICLELYVSLNYGWTIIILSLKSYHDLTQLPAQIIITFIGIGEENILLVQVGDVTNTLFQNV